MGYKEIDSDVPCPLPQRGLQVSRVPCYQDSPVPCGLVHITTSGRLVGLQDELVIDTVGCKHHGCKEEAKLQHTVHLVAIMMFCFSAYPANYGL